MKNNMDTIQFIEEILNIKLLDYQKRLIREIAEHPEYKIRMPRIRTYENTENRDENKDK